jgi:hypothetical protein
VANPKQGSAVRSYLWQSFWLMFCSAVSFTTFRKLCQNHFAGWCFALLCHSQPSGNCAKTILLSQTSMFWFSLSNFNLQNHVLSTFGAALATVLLEEVYQVWSQFLIYKSLA